MKVMFTATLNYMIISGFSGQQESYGVDVKVSQGARGELRIVSNRSGPLAGAEDGAV